MATNRAWRRRLFVSAVFMVAIAVMLRRTPGELANRFVGDQADSTLTMWILRWGLHGLAHNPLHVFNANIYWPNPRTLAYSDPMLSVAPVYGALYGVTGSWALAMNLWWIGFIALNLGATYSLTRWLTGRTDVAIFAGLAVGFSGFVFGQARHPALQVIGLVPLGLLLLFKLLDRPRWLTAVLFGVVNVVIAWGELYIATGYFIATVVILAGFAIAVGGRPTAKLLACVAVAGAITLLAAPIIVPYHHVSVTFGPRPLVPDWGLRPHDLLRPAPGSYLYKSLASAGHNDPGSGERVAFPGFSTMALALLGLGALLLDRRTGSPRLGPLLPPDRKRYTILLLIAGTVLAFLAVGASANIPTPWRLVHDHVPALSGIRVPARLSAFSLLAGAVLAAVGLTAILRHVRRPAAAAAITAVACLVVLAELAAPIPYTHLPDDPATLAAYHALSHRPAGAVIELPIYDPGLNLSGWFAGEPSRMVWSTIDDHPRVNGYSGYFPANYETYTAVIDTLPAPAAIAEIRSMKVRYLILHVGVQTGITMYSEPQAQAIINALPTATASRYGNNYLIDLGGP